MVRGYVAYTLRTVCSIKYLFCIYFNNFFSCLAVFYFFIYTFKSSVPHEVIYPTIAIYY